MGFRPKGHHRKPGIDPGGSADFGTIMRHATRIALMLLAWGLLLAWHLAADRVDCPVAAAVIALAAGLMALSGAETAFYRRHAFLSHYLIHRGVLFRFLGRRSLIIIRQGIKSLLLAFVLLIGALTFDREQWLLLLADVAVLAGLVAAFSRLFSGEVKERYRLPMARHWSGRVNALLLWIAWGVLVYVTPGEDFSGMRWEEVLAHSAHESVVGCDALVALTNLTAAGEALALWFAQNQFSGLQDPDHVLAAWGIFVAAFGASFLVAWAYSRMLVGTLATPWRVWREAQQEPEDTEGPD